MSFDLPVPSPDGATLKTSIEPGQCIYVLGANGTGKSSLMHRFYTMHYSKARRLSAHRQTWFVSGAMTLSPQQKRQVEETIRSIDTNAEARWKEQYSAERADIAIYDLIDAENVRARSIADAVDSGNIDLAKTLSRTDAPIKTINELLRLSGIPIEISVGRNQQVLASKSGSAPYSVAELSDGERNALLVSATVLTADPATLILIDEPERHLHRSIISPLLTLLFAKRPDCAFVISTHDVTLPLDNPEARVMLVRGCTFEGSSVKSWSIDLVQPDSDISEALKKDILGSRRKILFVEGEDTSLDKPLFSLLFPGVSIVAKSSCRDVEHAVFGLRGAASLHWLNVYGIIDNDRRTSEDIARLKAKGVYALSVYSVESAYYHPEVQRRVAERYAGVIGTDAESCLRAAKHAALEAVTPHIQRLSERVAERSVRDQLDKHWPKQSEISDGKPINIRIDVAGIVAAERSALEQLISDQDIEKIISRYPVRETPMLTEIARKLGFQSRSQYESAVRKLLIDDASALAFARSLFGSLATDMSIT